MCGCARKEATSDVDLREQNLNFEVFAVNQKQPLPRDRNTIVKRSLPEFAQALQFPATEADLQQQKYMSCLTLLKAIKAV